MVIFFEEKDDVKRRRLGLAEGTEVHQHDVPSLLPKLTMAEV